MMYKLQKWNSLNMYWSTKIIYKMQKLKLTKHILVNQWMTANWGWKCCCLFMSAYGAYQGGSDRGGSCLSRKIWCIKTSNDGMITFTWPCMHNTVLYSSLMFPHDEWGRGWILEMLDIFPAPSSTVSVQLSCFNITVTYFHLRQHYYLLQSLHHCFQSLHLSQTFQVLTQ
jgi:hypothetical protein